MGYFLNYNSNVVPFLGSLLSPRYSLSHTLSPCFYDGVFPSTHSHFFSWPWLIGSYTVNTSLQKSLLTSKADFMKNLAFPRSVNIVFWPLRQRTYRLNLHFVSSCFPWIPSLTSHSSTLNSKDHYVFFRPWLSPNFDQHSFVKIVSCVPKDYLQVFITSKLTRTIFVV